MALRLSALPLRVLRRLLGLLSIAAVVTGLRDARASGPPPEPGLRSSSVVSDTKVSEGALEDARAAGGTSRPESEPQAEAAKRPPLGKLVFHPEGPGAGKLALSLGLLWDYPPQRVVEGQISAFPMAEVNLRLGLPLGFSAATRIQTAFVTNEVLFGGSWTHVFDDIPGSPSLAMRLLGGAGFGGLVGFGFDAFLYTFLLRPGVAVGWQWRTQEVSFTVREDLITSTAQTGVFGGTSTRIASARLVGSETAFVVENPVHGGGNWYFGAAFMITRASYALWLPFAADEAFVAYPRFFVGYGF